MTVGVVATSWLILGGAGLYLGGHLAFKFIVWRQVSRQRAVALVVLALLGLLAPHVSALVLASCSAAVVVSVAAADLPAAAGWPVPGAGEAGRPDDGADAGKLPS